MFLATFSRARRLDRTRKGLIVAAMTLGVGACTDSTAPRADAPAYSAVKAWESGSSVAWNLTARELIAARAVNSPIPQVRILTYLSIAQYNAVVAAEDAKDGARHASSAAAAAGASVAVLTSFFPLDAALLESKLVAQMAAPTWPGARKEDAVAGEAIGRAIGAQVVAYAATDNYNLTVPPPNPGLPGNWTGTNSIRGLYGTRTLALTSGDQFRPEAPPEFGSPEFDAALAAEGDLARSITPDQLAIAQKWASRGPAYLNGVATEMIVRYHRSERDASRILALSNMAGFDGTNACFDAKFAYYLIRPSQADNTIPLPVGLPNHPSYPSGHSCQTASYATVLASFFVEEAERLFAMVTEAGLSRNYAGLHYAFDCEAGQQLGRDVANWVLLTAPTGHRAIALD